FSGDPLAVLPKPGGDPFGGGDPNPNPGGKTDPGGKPNPDPDPKTKPAGKPNPDPTADFTKIRKGMSEQERIKLVGEPTFKDDLKSGEWQFSGLKKEDVLKPGGGFKKVTQFKYFVRIPVIEVIFVDGHVHHLNNL